jgi:hypothetical protein
MRGADAQTGLPASMTLAAGNPVVLLTRASSLLSTIGVSPGTAGQLGAQKPQLHGGSGKARASGARQTNCLRRRGARNRTCCHKRRVPDPRMKADGAGDRCPDPPLGGSRRAWGSRRCRLAGRVRDFTVPFAQTIGALAPRPRRTGAGDSRAGCQRIRECRDAGAGREGARSHREVGGQAARQQATRLWHRGTGRGRACRHAGASHHFKRALRGGMTCADSDSGARPLVLCEGKLKRRAPASVSLRTDDAEHEGFC